RLRLLSGPYWENFQGRLRSAPGRAVILKESDKVRTLGDEAMETHDRPAGERPEESQAGTTPSVESRTGSSSTSEEQPDDVRPCPRLEQSRYGERPGPGTAASPAHETQGGPQAYGPQGPQAHDGRDDQPYGAPQEAASGPQGTQPGPEAHDG